MKLESMDERTGHPIGEVVEMTREELDKNPFNVFFKKIGDKPSKLEKAVKKVVEGDLDGDGDFDADDKSIAAKTLRKKTKK